MKRIEAFGKVGSKGELYPNIKIRELVGIKPGEKVLYIASKGKLLVVPIKNFLDLYKLKSEIKITLKEFEDLSDEIIK